MSDKDENKQSMFGKEITRRIFLKGSAALGVAAVAGPGLMVPRAKGEEMIPPMGSEGVFTTASLEGLLNVHVKDGRIIRLSSFDAPNIYASLMALAWDRRIYAPDRILYPMKRVDWKPNGGGNRETRGQERYVRISWEEAYHLVANELAGVKSRYGNEAILGEVIAGWGSSGNFHNKRGQINRFLGLFGGFTKLLGEKSSACYRWAAPYSIGTLFLPHSPGDVLKNSRLVIFWASDPLRTCWPAAMSSVPGSQVRDWVHNLKRSGKSIIVIDPVYTETARIADQWIGIRPGTDSALMAAMAYWMFKNELYDKKFIDEYTVGFEPFRVYVMGETDGVPKTPQWAERITGVSVSVIEKLAREFATTPQAFLCPGFGLQRQDYGEQQVRMIMTLAAMRGEIGLPGGGMGVFHVSYVGRWTEVKGRGPAGLPGVRNPVTQQILEQHFAYSLLQPPVTFNHNGTRYRYPEPGKSEIKLIYWVGGSSLNQHDEINLTLKALRVPETIIVQDAWWTPGARLADIVLPVNTIFERNDVSSFGKYVMFQPKIIESLGESKSDYDIFAELAGRLGFKDKFTLGLDEEGWLRNLYDAAGLRLSFEKFKEKGFYMLESDSTSHVAFAAYREDSRANPLNTESGKIEIFSKKIASFGYKDCPPTPQWMEPSEWLGSKKAEVYPLHLISNHPKRRRHSSYDNCDTLHAESKINGFEPLYIHAKDAASRGINTGDVVRVFNDRGQVLAAAHVTNGLVPGVVLLEEGSWYSPIEPGKIGSLDRGGSVNALTRQASTSQLAQGPVSHTGLVEVEKYAGPPVQPNSYAPIEPVS